MNYILEDETYFPRLSSALKQTAFNDALKSLGLNTGSGSDGKLPTFRSMKTRFTRQTESTECTKVLDQWKSFNSSAAKAVPGEFPKDAAYLQSTLHLQELEMTSMKLR